MKITIESSRIVKPANNGTAPRANHHIRLSVFDKVAYSIHIASIFAFNPPAPTNLAIEKGLSQVLSEYREWAGRLGEDAEGNLVIFLNDHGVHFVEATVDSELRAVLPSIPTKEIKSLHPRDYDVEELLQVQLTRFTCGSLVVGLTTNHQVADGMSVSNFLIAWGLATRGLAIDPFPLHARDTLFKPRNEPLIQYEHHNIEYMNDRCEKIEFTGNESNEEEIVFHKVHFTNEFINKLRSMASAGVSKQFSRFEAVTAHLWRVMTKARSIQGHETTKARISVDGRSRLDPKVPNEYFGNLALEALPRATANDLINRPLSYAVELIHVAVAEVNDSYFKSFIDFASSDAVSKEGLVNTSSVIMNKRIFSPDIDVDSWLRFSYYDVDFGSARPFYFMPSYFEVEGAVLFLPSYSGDGSIDALVTLFSDHVDTFKMYCYSLEHSFGAPIF